METKKDDVIRSKEDLEKLGLKVLGEIPQMDELKVPDPSFWERLRAQLEAVRRKK